MLPAELRSTISQAALAASLRMPNDDVDCWNRPTSLLITCRQIYDEAKSLYMAELEKHIEALRAPMKQFRSPVYSHRTNTRMHSMLSIDEPLLDEHSSQYCREQYDYFIEDANNHWANISTGRAQTTRSELADSEVFLQRLLLTVSKGPGMVLHWHYQLVAY
jgi:hypothetical protein